MTIEKLKSGSYRITQMENGKRYRITVDHKPSKNEATRLLADVIKKTPAASVNMTFDNAAVAYIESKTNILSPSTIRGYDNIRKQLPESFQKSYIHSINSMTVQKVVNDLADDHSPKTMRNYASFIVTVLTSAEIEVRSPQLPQKEKKSPYIPTKEDVQKLFNEIKGKDEEIAIILAAHSLRRSEIAALTVDDLDGNILSINKALVPDVNGKWVIKTTKTTESTRTIVIPQDLADLIRQKGFIYKKMPDSLNDDLYRAQDRAGVPRFSLHKLRHFFASYMHDKGFSDKQIQEMGGWKTDSIMKTVYQHAMDMDKAKKNMSDSLNELRG